jgi:predicted Zn-dependent peptidase
VAQQTLEVTLGEIRRMAEGVTEDEMARARTQLKSSLVMQGESTPSRAHALAGDWHLLGRLRSLREISDSIDGVKAGDVAEYMKAFPPSPLTVLVIGPEALKL